MLSLICYPYSKPTSLLTCYPYSKALLLLLLLMLSILISFKIAYQATKLMYQLILFTNAFLRLVDKYEKKAHVCHLIGKSVSEAIRRWLIGYS